MAFRIDQGRIDAIERTPQGGLRIPAALTRTGVLTYRDTTGKEWNELRPDDEVFAKDSLATLRGAPITDSHPDHMVTAQSWRDDAVGHAGDDVRRDGDFVAATVVVQDANAVSKVDAKELRELSCGYDCEIDPTPGEFGGVHYDAIQRKIRYNHVALLPIGEGRAGRDVALRMDGAAVQVTTKQNTAPRSEKSTAAKNPVLRADAQKESTMTVLKIGKREFKFDAAQPIDPQMAPVQAAVSDLEAQFDAVQAALADAMKQVAMLKVAMQADEAKEAAAAQADAAAGDAPPDEVLDTNKALRAIAAAVLGKSFDVKGKRRDAVIALVEDAIAKRAAEIDALRADAAKVLGEKFDLTGKKPTEIKRAVIEKVYPKAAKKLDSMEAKNASSMIDLLFDSAKEQPVESPRNDALAEAHRAAHGVEKDGTRSDANEDLDPQERMAKQRIAQFESANKKGSR